MSENNVTENVIKDGKMNLMGIDVSIADILGDKILDQYIAQLKEEDIDKIITHISSDLFKKEKYYDYEKKESVENLVLKVREKDNWGNYKDKNIPISELIKIYFNNRIAEELRKRVEEIISSTDYQNKINEIANELIEYSINGYKDDMKRRITERLVGNVLDAVPSYGSVSLIDIINSCIDERINATRY